MCTCVFYDIVSMRFTFKCKSIHFAYNWTNCKFGGKSQSTWITDISTFESRNKYYSLCGNLTAIKRQVEDKTYSLTIEDELIQTHTYRMQSNGMEWIFLLFSLVKCSTTIPWFMHAADMSLLGEVERICSTKLLCNSINFPI